MSSSLERLQSAYDEAVEASGPDFFRRLRDYAQLLADDRKIKRAVEDLKADVQRATDEFDQKDRQFVGDFVALRNQLVEREPNADDSTTASPGRHEPMDPVKSREWHAWIWTLANFDAVAADSEIKIVEADGLDNSRSRMLGAVLHAKLYDLVVPFNDRPAPRPDLRDLYDQVNALRHRGTAAHRELELVWEETGYLALLHIEQMISYLKPREPRPVAARGSEEELAWVNEVFKESLSGFVYLREAMRPKEARGSLDEKAQEALDRHERDGLLQLERLHRPLRKRLEGSPHISRWHSLSRSEKIAAYGVAATVIVGLAAIAVQLAAG